ncbi:hypothetical protein [Mesorhizobium sp.]|uniref:hypothetical protein n=1 Tax=Mesorhizobium sp. TaxID=1871066 RepID=UPI001209B57B|nr:hypothetical protein [Mesorhizobium sp.]TIL27434.1 MAG: hypothetical protein E5Y85_33345 [Mesorhizobium sp.]
MSQSPYEKALTRKAQLEADLQRVQSFLDMYAEFAGGEDAPAASQKPTTGDSEPITPYDELENIAVNVLIKNGRPLKRQQFYEAVKEAGANVGGSDERGNFGSKMSRSNRLVNLDGYGYWPKDKACAAANYFPPQTESGSNLFSS